MCTVTYLPLGENNFILTSNRDESPIRKTLPPEKYLEDGVQLVFPKDELAGGTWIGMSEKKRLVCLLNGGFENHQRNEYYKMSRGIIVKNLLTTKDPQEYINIFNFNEIEPFTIILVDWDGYLKAFQFVWDGNKKHFKELQQEPAIWSSSPLYNKEVQKQRKWWFKDWLLKREKFTQNAILEFHEMTGKGNSATDIKMKRPFVETVSITSVKKENEEVTMIYKDIKTNKVSKISL